MIILISENNVLWYGISDAHLLYSELYILISIILWNTHLGFMSSTSWFIIEHGYYLLENLHEVGNRNWKYRQVGKFYMGLGSIELANSNFSWQSFVEWKLQWKNVQLGSLFANLETPS